MASRLLCGASGSLYEVAVGLEVHAQVNAAAKLFSGASTAGGRALAPLGPNAAVALFDAAHPGTLPSPGRIPFARAVAAGVALRACVARSSSFERKHYFYGDLPLGYQVTQLAQPTVFHGTLRFDVPAVGGAAARSCFSRIDRVQLEQDSGKSEHDRAGPSSHVDLNRAGVALLEIVGAPDLRSAAEAGAYMRALRQLLRGAGIADGAMDEGAMRADVNVSVRRVSRGRTGGSCGGTPVAEADAVLVRARVAAFDAWRAEVAARPDTGSYVWVPQTGSHAQCAHDVTRPSHAVDAVNAGGGGQLQRRRCTQSAFERRDGHWRWADGDAAASAWGDGALRALQLDVFGAAGCGRDRRGGACSCAAAAAAAAGGGRGSACPPSCATSLLDGRGGIATAGAAAATSAADAVARPRGWGPPATAFGPRVELKNVASVRGVERAVASEAARQVAALEAGAARIAAETRSYDAATDTSTTMRYKEDVPDYRFMAEPDVAPLLLSGAAFRAMVAAVPPAPRTLAASYASPPLSLSAYDARVIVAADGGAAYFEAAVAAAVEELRGGPAGGWAAGLHRFVPAGALPLAEHSARARIASAAGAADGDAAHLQRQPRQQLHQQYCRAATAAAHASFVGDADSSAPSGSTAGDADPLAPAPLEWAAVAAAGGGDAEAAATFPPANAQAGFVSIVGPDAAAAAATLQTSAALLPLIAKTVSNWMASELFGRLGAAAAAAVPPPTFDGAPVGGAVQQQPLHRRGPTGAALLAGVQPAGAASAGRAETPAGSAIVTSDDSAAAAPPSLAACRVTPRRLGQLVALVLDGDVSGRAGKELLRRMLVPQHPQQLRGAVGGDVTPWPRALAHDLGLLQLNDAAAIQALADAVVADAAHADAVAKVRAGADRPLKTLVAQVLRASGGRANPRLTTEAVMRSLRGR